MHFKSIAVPSNEFWADPFLLKNPNNGKVYLFFERFPFKEKKGVIACGEVSNNFIVENVHDILIRPYHLSYPHLIEEDGMLFLMPESSANNELEIYKCDDFPSKWSLYSTALKGKSIADTVYYKDKNDERWIFTTISDSNANMHCTILNIYRIDSLSCHKVEPHHKNPIVIDCSCARNGGQIFEENGCTYRVAQDNSYGQYGYGISVRQILKLSIDEYEEKEIKHISGKDLDGYKGTHQLSQISGMFVMDLKIRS